MVKQYKIEVDCANCAAKIEKAIGEIEGVNKADISFIFGKLVVDFAEGADEKKLLKLIKKQAKRIEPDCDIYA